MENKSNRPVFDVGEAGDVAGAAARPEKTPAPGAEVSETPGPDAGAADTADSQDVPGVIADLGALPRGAIVTDVGLAKIFKRCRVSILRAVRRGELPEPFRLLGAYSWSVGALLAHFEKKQAERQKARDAMLKRISELSP